MNAYRLSPIQGLKIFSMQGTSTILMDHLPVVSWLPCWFLWLPSNCLQFKNHCHSLFNRMLASVHWSHNSPGGCHVLFFARVGGGLIKSYRVGALYVCLGDHSKPMVLATIRWQKSCPYIIIHICAHVPVFFVNDYSYIKEVHLRVIVSLI